MVLDLKHIFATPGSVLPINSELDMHGVDFMGVYPLEKPVVTVGKISNRAGLVTISITATYVFSAPCDLCGLPTEKPYSVVFEKSLAPEIVGEDSDSILPVPGMQLDLDELIFTEVYASLPMKHVCSSNCKGICPVCGCNLNTDTCNCNQKEIDPRLQALADLLKD